MHSGTLQVPSPWTAPTTVSATRAILDTIGQSPVALTREVDGFIVNRLQYALLMEAYRLVEVCISGHLPFRHES